jgi:hypothetical protein
MRVNMSAMGSVIILLGSLYQLAFRTPGIIPSSAKLRKQILQMPNLRYTALGRPQIRHRLTRRVENLGGRSDIAIFDLLAMRYLSLVLLGLIRDSNV